MNYIINPKLIYWISVLANLKIFLIISLLVPVAVIFISLIIINEHYLKEEEQKKLFGRIKISLGALLFSSITLIFIPSEKTIYKMIVFQNLTYENIEKGKETVKGAVDYIIEKMDKLKEEK